MGRRVATRAAFTLVEALVSLSIVAMAGSAVLLGLASSIQTTTESVERTIAEGLAQQLMDEIAGCPYYDPLLGPHPSILAPGAVEQLGDGRERYNDTGDFNGFSAQPPEDPWGVPIGRADADGDLRHSNFRVPESFFSRWRQSIEVYYVRDDDPSVRLPTGQTSNHRAVEIRITYEDPQRGWMELSRLRRVFAYVPSI